MISQGPAWRPRSHTEAIEVMSSCRRQRLPLEFIEPTRAPASADRSRRRCAPVRGHAGHLIGVACWPARPAESATSGDLRCSEGAFDRRGIDSSRRTVAKSPGRRSPDLRAPAAGPTRSGLRLHRAASVTAFGADLQRTSSSRNRRHELQAIASSLIYTRRPDDLVEVVRAPPRPGPAGPGRGGPITRLRNLFEPVQVTAAGERSRFSGPRPASIRKLPALALLRPNGYRVWRITAPDRPWACRRQRPRPGTPERPVRRRRRHFNLPNWTAGPNGRPGWVVLAGRRERRADLIIDQFIRLRRYRWRRASQADRAALRRQRSTSPATSSSEPASSPERGARPALPPRRLVRAALRDGSKRRLLRLPGTAHRRKGRRARRVGRAARPTISAYLDDAPARRRRRRRQTGTRKVSG